MPRFAQPCDATPFIQSLGLQARGCSYDGRQQSDLHGNNIIYESLISMDVIIISFLISLSVFVLFATSLLTQARVFLGWTMHTIHYSVFRKMSRDLAEQVNQWLS